MDLLLPDLRKEEKIVLRLRRLYEKEHYRLFRVGSFEEYDLYMQNRSFLPGDDIISFTGSDGRLMALKPDVTLSIVKSVPDHEKQKLYYHETVYRRSRQSGDYREISQMGIEYLGGDERTADAEALTLAAQSLDTIGHGVLDLSHMGLIELVLGVFDDDNHSRKAREALRAKSRHQMLKVAEKAKLATPQTDMLLAFLEISGPFDEALHQARTATRILPGAAAILDELQAIYSAVKQSKAELRLDFSILNNADYYNGLIFRGYVEGTPYAVLSGGRYDNLLHRFNKMQGAIGFALYLDVLESLLSTPKEEQQQNSEWLRVALPTGRMGKEVYRLFEEAGLAADGLLGSSRKLVFDDTANRVRYFMVKPADVHSYVEHGVADIGVGGKDVLLENSAPVLELLDLNIGRCRLAVAGPENFEADLAKPLRVATNYPNVTRRFYAAKSRSVEIIQLHGSIELAPITGLSDVIVDIVETGTTLKENNLAVLADVAPSSARLIANHSSWRFKQERIQSVAETLIEII